MDRLSDVRLFLLIAEERGFAPAARRAGISATVATRRIASLEADLGARLFNRSTRNVSLTEAGEVYRERAQEVIDAADRARHALEELRGTPRGTLAVTASPVMGQGLLQLMPTFLDDYPEIKVKFRFTEQQVDLIREGFDLAIRLGHPSDSTLVARQLMQSDSVICASPTYLEKRGKPSHPSDLSNHDCLTMRSKRWHFSKDSEQFYVPVDGPLEINEGPLIIAAAVSGMGIMMAPDWIIRELLVTGTLVQVLSDYQIEPKGTPVNAVYPARSHLPPKVRVFIDYLIEQYGENPT